MADLTVEIFGLHLANPVMPAAGPPVKDSKAAHAARKGGAGAIVTKTISVKGAEVPRPNMAQVRGGFMNTELWSELPPEKWLAEEYPEIVKTELPVIVGLGYTADEIRELAVKVEPYADVLELSSHYLGNDVSPVVESIRAARAVTDLPVMVKLSPQIDIPEFARAAEKAGADGIVLINSLGPTLDIDLQTGRSVMGSKTGYGWLSGEAIFPLALHSVYEAVQSVNIPVIGVGGISSGKEAIKMIMAGARAVQVCTAAIIQGTEIYGKIVNEMALFMDEHGYASLKDLRGLAQREKRDEANYRTVIPDVTEENCTGCGLCVTSCIYEAIQLAEDRDSVEIDDNRCAGCGLCVSRCNFKALSLKL